MDSKTVLAFILIGVIIILMPYYYKMTMPEQPELPPQQESSQPAEVQSRTQPGVTETEDHQSLSRQEFTEISADPGLDAWVDTTDVSETITEVETPLYIAKFSSRGGKIISFRLKEFDDRRGGMTEMIMKSPLEDAFYPNAYLTFQRNNLSTDRLNFEYSGGNINVRPGEFRDLVLTAKLGQNGIIRFIFTFDGDSYKVGLRTESDGVKLDDEYFFCWDGGVNVTELDTIQDLTYSKAYALMGGELEKFDAKGKGVRRITPTGKVDWMAVRSKYFEIAVIPDGNSDGIDFAAQKLGHSKTAYKEFKLALKMMNPGGSLDQDYTLYLGPMDSRKLSEFGVGLEATMNWGISIIKPFSKFILWSFKLLHTIIPNYGVVIVVFSILIKIVLWPLTHKSYVSMKKMSNLQPYMKEIKEKYKSDPQKMQKETAKLYKEHNVNPMGGCLPMLLQMPLLYGLFIVFRSTIELRGAPFMLWIKDLSLPDTIVELGFTIPMYGNQISILPLVMGVSTFFQSKQTMTDPNQKMLLYFMPIFLTLLFNNFPSGLTLYYTLFNLLSVVQQRMIQTNNKASLDVGKK